MGWVLQHDSSRNQTVPVALYNIGSQTRAATVIASTRVCNHMIKEVVSNGVVVEATRVI